MKQHKSDKAYLWDMREAALEAVEYLRGVTLESFLADPLRMRAIERTLEIIGEAAYHTSDETRKANAEIPWQAIIGQRHVLAHEYGEIDSARLYTVVTLHLPRLIAILDAAGLAPSFLRQMKPKSVS